ncbi:MAG TPA: cytochrome c-type biogenesis CcmF C-terminal domain-containing protein [Solirubrobacterales bacterium]|nr:cytochrome c-type biogenesis CcmF C-terminal domain-containing protein [Solirubrobacterales bacterium]
MHSSRRAVYALCGLLTICVVAIELAFARDDFSLNIVAQHSSTTTPAFYKLTAMWSSQEGSLLLWAWVLSIAASAALYATRDKLREIVPYATAVMAAIAAFFVGLMLFAGGVNPFATLSPVPADGVGLTPLLQHPSMMIHPPMLYSGYVAFTIPFAFAVGALITRRLDAAWIRSTRRFALIAWTFLGLGLLLGARWSYTELGWGGYWAWDPVENAALMPWLMATAFLHSIMVQEKRGMLKVWNVSLIVATFSLALLGTFLVRSGVLQSIHAFGDSTVGPYILGLIAAVLIGSTALIVSRLDDLRSGKRIDSLASREAVFLVNNLLLVALTVVIFWGTFFPLISEAFTGEKASLAAPWFDRYTTPLAVVLVLFTGIGPLLAWRRISWESAKRVFLWPGAFALLVAALLVLFTDASKNLWALGLFAFAAFSLAALTQEFWQGASARRSLSGGSIPAALLGVAARNRRRYGGYIVHAGIAVLLIGIAASSSFQTNRDISLRPGQSAKVNGYELSYRRPTVDVNDRRIAFGAVLDVRRDGKRFALLTPSRQYFRPTGVPTRTIRSFFEGEATSEVGLKAGLRKDFWTAMQPNISGVERRATMADEKFRALMAVVAQRVRQDPGQAAGAARFAQQVLDRTVDKVARLYLKQSPPVTFRVIVNPLVSWMWIGALIALAGAVIAIWPTPGARRRRVSSLYGARLGRELSRA